MTHTRALVVDTEADLAELLGYHLKKRGFKVSLALTSKKAIDLAESKCPSLIVISNLDSTHDHVKLGKKFRDLKRENTLTLICLVTDKKIQKKLLAKPRLFDGVLLVPMKPKEIMKSISEILARTQEASTSLPLDPNGANLSAPLPD